MRLVKAAVCVAGASVVVPVAIARLTWGKAAPQDFYEPTVAAWFATILTELQEFREGADGWFEDHPCL